MKTLLGQTVWITGAGHGIGEALALEMARQGSRVGLTARGVASLESLRDRMVADGRQAMIAPGDVTNPGAMHECAGRVEKELGPIDILVANAGTNVFTNPEAFDSAEYERLMQINYGGMLHAIEAVLPSMLSRGRGHIVGMASIAGYRGLPRAAAYGASKSAMIHFLESIRFHLKRRGIAVSICNPGFVRTPLTDKNDFRMPFLMEPGRAAEVICRGISREKKIIAFPFPFSTALALARILPYCVYEFIIERMLKNEY